MLFKQMIWDEVKINHQCKGKAYSVQSLRWYFTEYHSLNSYGYSINHIAQVIKISKEQIK